MIDWTSFLRRASIRSSSLLAPFRLARCSIRSRFISFANSQQDSSQTALRS
jgi:hypothetical protein